jgi:CubicO group peptidase (beta-lactamase class C family)
MPALDWSKVEVLLERARKEVDEGLLPSAQLALARDGEVVVNEAFGDATTDTRYVIFSCTKGIVAGAVWLAFGDGVLAPEQKVTEVFPEFGANGKDIVTVEQLLMHTSGFPRAPMGPDVWSDRQKRIQRMADWRLNWEPGTRCEYHPTAAHWVLAELLERATGTDYRQFIRQRIAEPLGLEGMRVGVPVEEQDGIATLVATGEPPDPDEVERLFGVREIPLGEVTEEALLHFPSACSSPSASPMVLLPPPVFSTTPRRAPLASPAAVAWRARPTSPSTTRPCSTTRVGCGTRRYLPTAPGTSATPSPTR